MANLYSQLGIHLPRGTQHIDATNQSLPAFRPWHQFTALFAQVPATVHLPRKVFQFVPQRNELMQDLRVTAQYVRTNTSGS